MRWWAYLLYLIIFSASVYGFYNFQLSRSLAVQKSERLQEITELKTKLYNNITHELRTPLTVILGMTEILKLKIQNLQLGTLVQPVKMIERNSQNLLHLVNEILDLAKIDSGNIKLNLQQADVIPFIKYVGESFHYLAAEKRIKLNIHSADHELVMDYDADKLAIIISNLLSNAIKYTPEEGEVSVHINSILLAGKTYLSIKIKDNGLGIPVKEIPYIFDRFYQGDYSSVQRSQGTGIGLALTKSLVELMKGSIQVESADGKGSEFMVQLPIHRKALRVEKPADISFPIHSINPSDNHYYEESTPGEIDLPLVLIIEDHVDVAQYIGACLQGKYQYLFASNGKLGIEMALEKIPDLIISDIKMPQKDGFEVCATLKLDERTNHIPIILLTARVTDQDRLTGLAHGADAYLAKPFKKEELWIRLDKLSELRKTLQKKYSKHLLIDTPVETSVSKEDPFIEKARMVLMAELENEDFSLEDFSEKLHLSKSQVYRKIKAVTGMSTAIFIRTIRLHMARKMLVSTNFTISEIAFKVGFKSPTYFSQSFKETFDKSPSDLRK
jgi:CheY-like chemotaxis protein